MDIPFYQIDAFTSRLFKGNPAGVCVLPEPLDDGTMQSIAAENALPETAFLLDEDGLNIRWFTPTIEVDLCGHATLAAAHALFEHEGFESDEVSFWSRSGTLRVRRSGEHLTLDFPVDHLVPEPLNEEVERAIGITPQECHRGRSDLLVVLRSQQEVEDVVPDLTLIAGLRGRGTIVTAPGNETDFVSRFFAPQSGIDEDPVTGSAHTSLAPYWSKRLGRAVMSARQLSPRGGELECEVTGDRVAISGRAVTYLRGTISLQ